MTSIWKLKIWLKTNDGEWTKHCRNFCIGRNFFFSRILSTSFLEKICHTFGPYLSPQLNFWQKFWDFFSKNFTCGTEILVAMCLMGAPTEISDTFFFGPYIGSSSPQVSLLYHQNRKSYILRRFMCTIQ